MLLELAVELLKATPVVARLSVAERIRLGRARAFARAPLAERDQWLIDSDHLAAMGAVELAHPTNQRRSRQGALKTCKAARGTRLTTDRELLLGSAALDTDRLQVSTRRQRSGADRD